MKSSILQLTYSVTINNKKYSYTLTPVNKQVTFVECEAANMAQDFLNEDIPALLLDLPNLILSEKKYKEEQNQVIRFRVSSKDKKYIQKKAFEKGYKNVSNFLRDLALKA